MSKENCVVTGVITELKEMRSGASRQPGQTYKVQSLLFKTSSAPERYLYLTAWNEVVDKILAMEGVPITIEFQATSRKKLVEKEGKVYEFWETELGLVDFNEITV